MSVGVLAVQGGFAAHLRALHDVGVEAKPVRYPGEVAGLTGLVLPGGESSTQLDMCARLGLFDALDELHRRRVPILATCAGVILSATRVEPQQRSLGWIDIDVCRNAYGSQLDSFAARDDSGEIPLVFIRAPRITRVGAGVRVLATHDGDPVLVEDGHVTAATFHPELSHCGDIHARLFAAGSSGAGVSARSRPLGDEGGVLQDVEQERTDRAEHVGR